MHQRLSTPLLPSLAFLAAVVHAQDAPAPDADAAPQAQAPAETPATPAEGATSDPPRRLIWSLGTRLRLDDLGHAASPSLRPMIGLRYGRWRTGAVNGDTWHRFGQIKTDNALTYDWLDSPRWRTGLTASIVNLQKDSPTDAIEPGRKTVRGKATIDYLGWSHWSVGWVLTQDLLGRGAGTAISPSVTYRQALSEDSTILLSQSFTWATAEMWRTSHELSPTARVHAGTGWGSADTSLTLRQRWKAHWSWFAQLSRSQTLGPFYMGAQQDHALWSGQAGVVYFSR